MPLSTKGNVCAVFPAVVDRQLRARPAYIGLHGYGLPARWQAGFPFLSRRARRLQPHDARAHLLYRRSRLATMSSAHRQIQHRQDRPRQYVPAISELYGVVLECRGRCRYAAYFYPLPAGPTGRPPVDFTQARVVAEFSTSPWAHPDLLAPPARLKVTSFDRLTPPPYEAEIVNVAGKAGGISAPWWRHHRVSTRPGRARATASSLWDDGYGITVYFQ
jgi:hypothetical protein